MRQILKLSTTIPLALLSATFLRAQTAPPPQFEVATVKVSPPPSGDAITINLGTVLNGRLAMTNVTLSDCIKLAYGIVSDDQLVAPDWIMGRQVRFDQVRFDIVAQAPPDTPRDRVLLMLQPLLAERLKLVLHHEQKQLSYLGLTVAKTGPKIRPAKPGAPLGNSAARGRIVANQMPMSGLATVLSRFERETVVDLTGLSGAFEFKLEWTPDGPVPPDGASGPSLFTAVQQQLGLRLESRKGPLDVLVVDHAEKVPTEN
jgi:uncharacterized protein (TIGR03435 family)